jgi:hypothetical protein
MVVLLGHTGIMLKAAAANALFFQSKGLIRQE